MSYKFVTLGLISLCVLLFYSCGDDPVFSSTRKAKVFLKGAGTGACVFNPFSPGNTSFSTAVFDKDGKDGLTDNFNSNDLKWGGSGGYYLEMDVPIYGEFGIEVKAYGDCNNCCDCLQSESSRPIYKGFDNSLSAGKSYYVVVLSFQKCLCC